MGDPWPSRTRAEVTARESALVFRKPSAPRALQSPQAYSMYMHPAFHLSHVHTDTFNNAYTRGWAYILECTPTATLTRTYLQGYSQGNTGTVMGTNGGGHRDILTRTHENTKGQAHRTHSQGQTQRYARAHGPHSQGHTMTHRDTLQTHGNSQAPPPESCFSIILHVISAIIFFN